MGERSRRERERGKLRERSKSRKSRNKKEARCYKCNDIGHFKRDCPQWKNNKGDKGGCNALSMMADGEMEDDFLMVSDGHRQNTDVWILNSACSHHYTPNRS